VFIRSDGLNLVECNNCGLCFINPSPKPEFIPRLYDKNYFINLRASNQRINTCACTLFSEKGLSYNKRQNSLLVVARLKLAIAEKHINMAGKKCLEVGCATGEFCKALSERGAKPLGLDISDYAISVAKKRYPTLDFRNIHLEQISDEEKFDAIFAFELIEHLYNPNIFWEKVQELLPAGGLLVFSTPNYGNGKIVGLQNWIGLKTSFEHLYYYSVESLTNYGNKYGFSLVSWYTGNGNGVELIHRYLLKLFSKNLLSRLGLLEWAERVKVRYSSQEHDYVERGDKYNLFAIFIRR
jgi:2-polyprenyl-3-methyl-5-hydroxy-6-metoxy-1,4-benzoquinol methylase